MRPCEGNIGVRDAYGRAAGVDLPAKFYAGSDDIGGAGERIQSYAARYMFAGAKDPVRSAEILFQGIRNPLLHSFPSTIEGLRSGWSTGNKDSISSKTLRNRE